MTFRITAACILAVGLTACTQSEPVEDAVAAECTETAPVTARLPGGTGGETPGDTAGDSDSDRDDCGKHGTDEHANTPPGQAKKGG